MSPTTDQIFKSALILHGGAGNLKRSTLPPDLYAAYHASLQNYLRSTYALLNSGTSALNAAVYAVSRMEDDELFNCGRGSVFTTAGTIEMEASVMVTSVRNDMTHQEGVMKRGAGVMGVRNVRHPIHLARESLLRTGYTVDGQPAQDGGNLHSQLDGPNVEILAREWGLEFMPDEWFWTKRRWEEHLRGLRGIQEPLSLAQGTVGCVCLDQWGNLAVATSTGGMTNKLPGRIGDTPTLGAGFWAEAWDEVSNGCRDLVGSLDSRPDALTIGDLVRDAACLLADCLPQFLRESPPPAYTSLPGRDPLNQLDTGREKASHCDQPPPPQALSKKRAIAVSGTGNGDSFLRVAAARTVSAMLRFSSADTFPTSLADAVTVVAGPGGELQRSAGQRWNKTGEGEGGIIGIEAEADTMSSAMSGQKLRRGKVAFDFNCGGMWRAWIEEDDTGKDVERIMVFREEYTM